MKIKSIIIPLISSLLIISLLLASCSTTQATTTPATTITTTKTTTTPPVTTAATTTTAATSTTPVTSTVLTVVNGTTTQNYTISQLKALPPTTGYGATKNKAGAITGPNTYVGATLTSLIKAAGGMTSNEQVTVTAQDGYSKTLTYAQVYQGTFSVYDKNGNPATAGTQPFVSLVYSMDGNDLATTIGPVEMGIMTASDQASDASMWIKLTNKIEIIPTTRTVIDSTGATITIPYVVNRVADAWHANNEIVFLLGGASKLVATTTIFQALPWAQKLYPQIITIPAPFTATAGQVNMETLIAAHPDVLLVSAGSFTADSMAQFKTANIPVVQMPAATFDDLKTTVRITGDVLGGQAVSIAADYINYLNTNIQKVTAVTSTIPAAQKPNVFHTSQYLILSTDGANSLIDAWINYAGGIDVASKDITGNQKAVTAEQIAAWNPDIIIVGTAPNSDNVKAILSDPKWSSTNAVKNKKVIANPTGDYLWDRYSAEEALQILWAAKLLYPDKFTNIDINQETKNFYSKYFHYTLTDSDLNSIMNATAP